MRIKKDQLSGSRCPQVPAVGRLAGCGAWLLALLVATGLGTGCKKPASAPPVLPPPSPETIARVHWLGKQRLAADTNAASVMAVWNLAQSRRLEAQVLDRLAVGLLTTNDVSAITNQLTVTTAPSAATNQPLTITNYQAHLTGAPALLRPLLEDVLQHESFLEIRQVTNQPGELALAIRLDAERAGLWETNLAAVVESLAGGRVTAVPGRTNGWELRFPCRGSQNPWLIELARAGEWTVVGLAPQTNALAGQLCRLASQTGQPFAEQSQELWLDAQADPGRVARALSPGWNLPADLPRLTVGFSGNGQSVRTHGHLDFPKPLPSDLGQWNIPTNLVHEPLISFTAIRGATPWLSRLKSWQGLGLGSPQEQLYFWGESGLPFLSFFAARLPNASNLVSQITSRLVEQANPWLATNSQGTFERATNYHGVIWKGLPLAEPFLRSGPGGSDDLVFGGLVRDLSTNRAPATLFQQITGPTNLVAYDWEMTGTRTLQWLYFGQFFRLFLHHAQVPPKSASVAWLSALEFKLGNYVSAVSQTGPAQLSFLRRSTIGLNSIELHLLADWFESPQFPRGLRTFVGPPESPLGNRPPRKANRTRTNSVPASPGPPASK